MNASAFRGQRIGLGVDGARNRRSGTCRSNFVLSARHGITAKTSQTYIPRWWRQRADEPCLRPQTAGQQRLTRDISARSGGGLTLLAQDVLYFLGSTVMVIPLFKQLKVSPVLGFLASGIILNQLGLTKDLEDLESLSELGVLFLLFEMGLELSIDRLKALAKYAFGMGTLQMLLCTGIFAVAGLPAGGGLVTKFLEDVAHAPHSLVSIRSLDEAIVIGGALSLSSSAFVLQLLAERGELPTRFGSATLGILLLQDIAVVPFLVLLPLIEQSSAIAGATPVSLVTMLGPTALKTVGGLGLLLVGGRVILRRVFEVVAASRNTEAFLALCLLTVAGAAYTTNSLGFSDTMGAFIAGVLLSETNYKTQVEADIKPFRGLLLGLFFTTTGGSIDMSVLQENWQVIAWLLAGLVATKTAVIAALGKGFGLTSNESLRIGFMLSQGGEFAFVLLSLAAQLKVLPENLNQVLIIVVVMSMALTPGLAEAGKFCGEWLDTLETKQSDRDKIMIEGADSSSLDHTQLAEPIVICGFGPQSQLLANMLENPLIPNRPSYVVFDLDPVRVQNARQSGFPVIFGDGSRMAVLQAAGVQRPRAFVVCHRNKQQAVRVVDMVHSSFPNVPVYACGADLRHAAELEEVGAMTTVVTTAEAGLSLGCRLLSNELGMTPTEIAFLKQGIDNAMTLRTSALSAQMTAGVESQDPLASADIIVLDKALHNTALASTMEEPCSSSSSDEDDEVDNGNGIAPGVRDNFRELGVALAVNATGGPPGDGASSEAAIPLEGMVVAATATMFESVDSIEVATMVQCPAGSAGKLANAELPQAVSLNDSLDLDERLMPDPAQKT